MPGRAPTQPSTVSTRAPSKSSSTVRRNLFSAQLSKRPPPQSTASNPQVQTYHPLHHSQYPSQTDQHSTDHGLHFVPYDLTTTSLQNGVNSDIVKRGVEGDFEWNEPQIGYTEEEEMEKVSREQDKLRKTELSDAIASFRNKTAEVDEEILVEEVKHSLREKIARLAEDDWMYPKTS